MKRSIKKQMTVVFIGLIAFMLILIFAINSVFLEQYYIIHKQTDLVSMYKTIDKQLSNGKMDDDEVVEKLIRQTEKSNISVVIISKSGDKTFSTMKDDRENHLYTQLFGYMIGESQGKTKILKSTKSYQLCKTNDFATNSINLQMWGYFSDGSLFILSSPLESIQDSAALANKFLIYIGIVAVILGGILVWLFSKKITEPIMELAALSQRMANLDFEARYSSGGDNEIGILGKNFNTMSGRLKKTVSELKSANNQLQKDIEQKEKIEDMRNEFLGNVSHELKTPIALIQGYAEGLKEGVNDDPESREFYCDVIMDEANKMNQMVKNLLTLNQLEFGSEELVFERFDVTGLIRGVLSSCEILIRQAEADVEFIVEGSEPVYVWADEFKTEQVFRNYLTNAIHHAENEKRIEVRLIPQGNNVRITVFNSGTPIPEEDLNKLWDKFYKVDKAHTREYGGNGIGLSIVKAIMESFHQSYGVQNFDNGVEFWFELDTKVTNDNP